VLFLTLSKNDQKKKHSTEPIIFVSRI